MCTGSFNFPLFLFLIWLFLFPFSTFATIVFSHYFRLYLSFLSIIVVLFALFFQITKRMKTVFLILTLSDWHDKGTLWKTKQIRNININNVRISFSCIRTVTVNFLKQNKSQNKFMGIENSRISIDRCRSHFGDIVQY